LFWEDDFGRTYSRVGNISNDTDTDGSDDETGGVIAVEAENKVLSERIVLLEAKNKALSERVAYLEAEISTLRLARLDL
jgi:hypothetical protein